MIFILGALGFMGFHEKVERNGRIRREEGSLKGWVWVIGL